MPLDGGLGEGDPQVVVLPEVMVVQVNEGLDRLLHRAHLDQCHLAVLLEELESFDDAPIAGEQNLEILFGDGGWDVGEVQRG